MSCAATGFAAAFKTSGPGLMLTFLGCAINQGRSDIKDEGNRVKCTPADSLRTEYDFIIIGGGGAGAVITGRLAENPKWTILLIDAGQDEPTSTEIPLTCDSHHNAPHARQLTTEKSDKACLSTGGICPLTGSNCLGGSTTIGETIQTRGNRRDYDLWERLGNTNWDFDYLEDIFKHIEHVKIPEFMNKTYRGYEGKISTEFPRFLSPMAEHLMSAGADLNYLNPTKDYNSQQQCGFAQIQQCLKCGLRCSSAKSYLRPLANATNVHFSLGSNIMKILIDDEHDHEHHERSKRHQEHHHHATKRAYGVRFTKDGKIYDIKATKEIILASSSLYNPKILMLSGIGPRKELKKHNIKCIHHLRGIGENLMDHISFKGLNYQFKNQTAGKFISLSMADAIDEKSMGSFASTGDGPIYATPGQEITAFINSRYPELDKCTYPDIQLMFGPLEDQTDGFSLITMLLRPKSRGCISLNADEYLSPPKIDAKYLDDPRDSQAMLSGIRFAQRIIETKTFKDLGTFLCPLATPECDKLQFDSDDYWLCMIAYNTRSHNHIAGTCKMGPHDDKMAVCDHNLKIHGIRNLRITGSSIMPKIISGNSNMASIMISEYLAIKLKREYKYNNGLATGRRKASAK